MEDLVIQIASVVISLLSAAVSVVFAIRANRDTRLQHQFEIISLRSQYYSELQAWAERVVDAMSEAIFLYDLDPHKTDPTEFHLRYLSAKQHLSSLVDKGRWFLPNNQPEARGQEKPKAYAGIRQKALDDIIAAYRTLESSQLDSGSYDLAGRRHLWQLRKSFVSELQDILDPRGRENELERIVADISRGRS